MILKHGLLALQSAAVKDFKILHMCMAAVKECAFETHPAHALKKKSVIFIANVSSTILIFVNICSFKGKNNEKC